MPTIDFEDAFRMGDLWLHGSGTGRDLLVFVHGWRTKEINYRRFIQAFQSDADFHETDFLPFRYDASFWSNVSPGNVAEGLASDISRFNDEYQYKSIYLVAHSLGGMIARAAVLGGIRDHQPWARQIKRILLLAATNRGFMAPGFLGKSGLTIATLINRAHLIRAGLRGAPFTLDVRLRWMRTGRDAQGRPVVPETVQLLGDGDEIVAEDDSADIYLYENAHRPARVNGKNHNTIARLNGSDDPHYQRLKHYLFKSFSPRQLGDQEPYDHVVMIMHGIRDHASWQEELGLELKNYAQENRLKVKPEPVDYSWFPILSFLFRKASLRKMLTFFDRYLQAAALSPTAQFHFVGHSNGTYIFVEALRQYRAMIFSRAYLCGSVLPRDFTWGEFRRGLGDDQLSEIRNDCATKDLPVGFLCEALHALGMRRVGSGGYLGFTSEGQGGVKIEDFKWLSGGHGAAKNKSNYRTVAEYLLANRPSSSSPPGPPSLVPEQVRWMESLNKAAPYVLVSGAFALLAILAGAWLSPITLSAKIIVSVVWVVFVSYMLARF
jgi:pimeloyl-ACP methyl ester carboxylesterase